MLSALLYYRKYNNEQKSWPSRNPGCRGVEEKETNNTTNTVRIIWSKAEEVKTMGERGHCFAHLRKAFPGKVISEPRLAGCVGVRWRSQDKGIPGEGNTMHIQRIGGVRVLFPAMLRSSIANPGVAEDEAWRSNSYFSIPKALCS